MVKRTRLFTIDEDIEEIISKIPWGTKSEFVNECVRTKAAAVEKNFKEKRNFPNGSKESEASSEQKSSSSNSTKQSKEADHTASQPHKSKPSILGQLFETQR